MNANFITIDENFTAIDTALSNGIQYAHGAITNLNLENGLDQQLIAAPGVNFVIVPISITLVYKYPTSQQWTNNIAIDIVWGNVGQTIDTFTPAVSGKTTDQVFVYPLSGPTGPFAKNVIQNVGVYWSPNSANYNGNANQDNTVQYDIYYIVVNTASA